MVMTLTQALAAVALLGLVTGASTARARELRVIRTIPNLSASQAQSFARTEGLDFHDGYLWRTEEEAVAQIDPRDGRIVRSIRPPQDYTEGLTWFLGKLWMLTEGGGHFFVADFSSDPVKWIRSGKAYGWGLTHDSTHLIWTGGAPHPYPQGGMIHFSDPVTFKIDRTIQTPLYELEDLDWDGRSLWSSTWHENHGLIFQIDPVTGAVLEKFSLPPAQTPAGSIDGIASDGEGGMWIAGKYWPVMFHVEQPR
jgi:glutaminyl-peptide cyclotransferase